MIPFLDKLSQIFTLIALSVMGLVVALVFIQSNVKIEETDSRFYCGTTSEFEYRDTVKLSGNLATGKALFDNNCQQCHSPGADVVVGPGLRGIMDRRPKEWLIPWIQNSQKMIAPLLRDFTKLNQRRPLCYENLHTV